ncbi:hypothetical protein J6590_099489, partial [Homalodisca vitripennis]
SDKAFELPSMQDTSYRPLVTLLDFKEERGEPLTPQASETPAVNSVQATAVSDGSVPVPVSVQATETSTVSQPATTDASSDFTVSLPGEDSAYLPMIPDLLGITTSKS